MLNFARGSDFGGMASFSPIPKFPEFRAVVPTPVGTGRALNQRGYDRVLTVSRPCPDRVETNAPTRPNPSNSCVRGISGVTSMPRTSLPGVTLLGGKVSSLDGGLSDNMGMNAVLKWHREAA